MGINSTFKEAVERATSPTLLEPDWAAILQVCDSIRQKDVSGKVAVNEIKRKIFDTNPHVSKNALITLEACVKNCGAIVHDEIATKALMDDFRQFLKLCPDTVKQEILRIIQAWAHGFRNEPKYKVVEDTRNLLKMEGYNFPDRNESDAMFSALKAPDWADGDVCHRCRVKFATFTRQHHCRCCGQVFCNRCSSKVSTIPKFGIEREVRVCDTCYDQLNPGERTSSSQASSSAEGDLPPEYLRSALAKESQVPEKKSAEEIKRQEQEDLQLAMALSVSEEESKQSQRSSSQLSNHYSVPETKPSAPAIPSSYIYSSASMEEEEEEVDPELARYLNRPYWENRKEANPPAYQAPSPSEPPTVTPEPTSEEPVDQTPSDQETEAFMNTFRSNIEKLMQRMKYVSGKGRHISTDTITQSLFQAVSAMHPQLLALIEQQEQEKEKYEGLQEKLGVLEDTRRSLDDLRAQKREKLRQQELEQDMLRRMQMEQKMELLRQQKAEYMLYQQQLQVQRQQALEQRAKEQAMASSYGMYQPASQYPITQDTKTGIPDGYTQPTYNPGEVPPQFQQVNPTTQPPAYQSVTPGTQPISTYPPGAQRLAQQPPPYQSNQYEPPVTQYQSMSLQTEDRVPPTYQPGIQPVPNQGQLPANGQPPSAQTYQSNMNHPQGMRPQVSQQYPQPTGPPPQGMQPQQAGQPSQALQQTKPQTHQPGGQYKPPSVRSNHLSYLDSDIVADSPQQGTGQRPNGQGYLLEPDYPSSGPRSLPVQPTQPAPQNIYNRTPPSSGPPSLEQYSGQNSLSGPSYNRVPSQPMLQPQQPLPPQGPPSLQGPPSQQGLPPPQQGLPPQQPPSQQGLPPQQPPPQHQPPPQQGPPPHQNQPAVYSQQVVQGPPSGPPSLQYPNRANEQSGPYPGASAQVPGGQQSWGQAGGGNYAQPAQQQQAPPSYGSYEPVQQSYGQLQLPQQQYYEQNVAEAQLISFD